MRGRRARSGRWHEGWWCDAQRRPSPNANERPAGTAIDLVVLHSISLPAGVYGGMQVEQLFANTLDCAEHPSFDGLRGLRVSAHFFVRRDGRVIQFVPVDGRAWHAGVSRWGGREACNDFSIGIELEGLEGGRFEDAQMRRLRTLVVDLASAWPIREVVGHEHIAPGRKRDPGAGFEWARLAMMLKRRAPTLAIWNDVACKPLPALRATTGKR